MEKIVPAREYMNVRLAQAAKGSASLIHEYGPHHPEVIENLGGCASLCFQDIWSGGSVTGIYNPLILQSNLPHL